MGKKLLIIDDNEQDRKIMKRFLAKAGFEDIIIAETGELGVEKAACEKPDIIVLDTLLPGISGFEACRRIREASGPDKPKIIIMTGNVDAIDAVEARKAGADDYCVKTSDHTPLLEAAKKLL
ncbi:MAG: response regulator [Candidatus Omnitrophica bacterium]|nr:response regulator [Candidatus Omnitrophota bacterium]